jgi:hypothetical protein
MLIQCSFSDLEYASKGYLTRRDRLLRDLDALTHRGRRCLPRSSP